MADIGEKRRLGPVDLRQGFRALALFLISLRIGEPGGNLARNEIDEADVCVVEPPVRVNPRHEKTGRTVLALLCHRRDDRFERRLRPRASWKPLEAMREAADRQHRWV